MKKLLLFGYYGEGNLGDDLLLESLIKNFHSRFYLGILTKKNDSIGRTSNVRIFDKFSFEILKGIMWSDIVIGGGGGIFQDKTSLRSFYYYFFVVFLALLLKKRVFLLGQSFSPLRFKINEILLKKLLNCCEAIYLRDSFSKKYLEKIGVKPHKIKLSTDLSLLIDFPEYDNEKGNALGINLRSWRGFEFKEKDLETFLNNIAKNFEKIYFFSFQQEDYQVCKRLLGNLKSKVIPVSPNDPNFWKYFSSCSLFIGMRLHSCIISMSLGIPFIAITYDEKVKAFCEEIGWKYFVENFDFDKILSYIKELEGNFLENRKLLLSHREFLREKIRRDMEYFEKEICIK